MYKMKNNQVYNNLAPCVQSTNSNRNIHFYTVVHDKNIQQMIIQAINVNTMMENMWGKNPHYH